MFPNLEAACTQLDTTDKKICNVSIVLFFNPGVLPALCIWQKKMSVMNVFNQIFEITLFLLVILCCFIIILLIRTRAT